MKPADKRRLAVHLAQARLARMAQAVALAAGLLAALRYGLAGILAGILAAWFFSLAKPGPDARLDKLTGRGDD